MSRSTPRPDRGRRGFTLVETLVALAVATVSLAAIGSLAAGSFRSARHVERHLAEIETTEAIIAALPGRDRLADAALSGETGGYRWRLESAPFRADFVDPRARTPWTPQRIVLSVQGPTGEVVSFDMIRLVRTPAR